MKPAAPLDSVQTTKAQGLMLQPKSMTLGMISVNAQKPVNKVAGKPENKEILRERTLYRFAR